VAEEPLLTVREVAQRIRASRESVRRWIRDGRLQATRPGGTKLGYRIRESEVTRFLESGVPTDDTTTEPRAQ
jgi:excisionase family DNA binding protein